MYQLKIESRHDVKFVVTAGTYRFSVSFNQEQVLPATYAAQSNRYINGLPSNL